MHMTGQKELDRQVIEILGKVKGIVLADRLNSQDIERILELESAAEERSILGMGKLINSGLREVLARDRVYVALTNMEFDWGCSSSLLLRKGDEVVGEEVHDDEAIRILKQTPDVWFMHDSFVIYKDRMSFPKDLADDTCRFEIPCLPADWLQLGEVHAEECTTIYANPSPPCDLFLKESYFSGDTEHGFGTILIGITSLGNNDT